MKPKEHVNYITKLHCPINSVLSYSEKFKKPLLQSNDNGVYYTITITASPSFKMADYYIIIRADKDLEFFNDYEISGHIRISPDGVQSMLNDINNSLDVIEFAIESYIEAKRAFDDAIGKIKTEMENWKVVEE